MRRAAGSRLRIDDAKTRVRQHVYKVTGVVGVDYPAGLETDLHIMVMGSEAKPEVIAVKLCQKYWPEAYEEYLRRPICETCKGTGQGEKSYEACPACNGWGRKRT